MISHLAIVPVAMAAYVATNLDNLTLLVTLLARFRHNALTVVFGYLVCMALLILVAYWVGRAAGFIPVDYLGLLGVVPVTIGVVGLARLFRGVKPGSDEAFVSLAAGKTVFVATFLTQLGNGADTIVTVGALFADSNPSADELMVITLGGMALLFAAVAVYAVRHPALGSWVERNAERVTPFILIAVGAYILFNTATDLTPQ